MLIAQEVQLLFDIFDFFNTVVQGKSRAIVHNTNYFKPFILKFKTFVYNSNSKIIYNFCMNRGNTPPVREMYFTMVFLERKSQNKQN